MILVQQCCWSRGRAEGVLAGSDTDPFHLLAKAGHGATQLSRAEKDHFSLAGTSSGHNWTSGERWWPTTAEGGSKPSLQGMKPDCTTQALHHHRVTIDACGSTSSRTSDGVRFNHVKPAPMITESWFPLSSEATEKCWAVPPGG